MVNSQKTPNKKELLKRQSDEAWASILLRYLNSKGYDYEVREPYTPPGWADVDVFAMSISGKHPSLYIQLTLDTNPKNSGYEKIWKNSKSHTFKNFGQTTEAIRGKVEKYTKQKMDFSQITLVIKSYYLIKDDEIYRIPKLYDECKQYKFKAIYLLSPKGQIYGSDKQPKEQPEFVFQIV